MQLFTQLSDQIQQWLKLHQALFSAINIVAEGIVGGALLLLVLGISIYALVWLVKTDKPASTAQENEVVFTSVSSIQMGAAYTSPPLVSSVEEIAPLPEHTQSAPHWLPIGFIPGKEISERDAQEKKRTPLPKWLH